MVSTSQEVPRNRSHDANVASDPESPQEWRPKETINKSTLRFSNTRVSSIEKNLVKSRSNILKRHKTLKVAVLHMIEDCINDLYIAISIFSPIVGASRREPLVYESLKNRFSEEDYSSITGVVYTDIRKIQKKVREVIAVLEDSIDEIIVFSEPTCIDMFAEIHCKMKTEEDELLEEVERKKKRIISLRNEISTCRDDFEIILQEIDNAIDGKVMEMLEVSERLDVSRRYVQNWQLARKEQNLLSLEKQENSYVSRIEDGRNIKIPAEDACHSNIIDFSACFIDDYYEKIETLMDAHSNEMEEREIKIYKMKNDIETVKSDKIKVEETYEKRAKAIEDWKEYKRLKREREERAIFENRAATKIQAWWRGQMYRKKLGPYRIKKGKKNKNKKGNVNKKGKSKK